MSLVKWGFIGLFLLPAAEIAAFVLLASLIGWLWTVCLFLATTVLGILILRHSGGNDIERFRAAVARDGLRAVNLESPGLGPVLGGILLVFPGFITDILGGLLLVPAVRHALRAAMARAGESRRRKRHPEIVDLSPQEWHQVPDKTIEDRGPRKRVR